MDVLKNKNGEYFILVEQEDDEKALLVTPSGEIKSLELRFFGEAESIEEGELLAKKAVSDHQISRYHHFVEKVPFDVIRREAGLELDPLEVLLRAKGKLTRRQWESIINKLEYEVSTAKRKELEEPDNLLNQGIRPDGKTVK